MAGAAGEGERAGRRVGRVGWDGEELVVTGEGRDGHGGGSVLLCRWWWVCWVLLDVDVDVDVDALVDGVVGVLVGGGGWERRRGEGAKLHAFGDEVVLCFWAFVHGRFL